MTIGMGIIKIEVSMPEATKALEEFKRSPREAFETISTEVRSAVSNFFNQLLNTEMTFFLGRADQSGNKRNGYEERTYALKGLGAITIKMPVDRKSQFKSEVIKPREQIDPRFKEDLALLHLAGISSRMMAVLSKRVLGVQVSADTVSKSLSVIEDRAKAWLVRPIDKKYWALFIDGTNFKVQRRGSVEKEPSLVVLGVDDSNCMSVLAIEPGTKDDAKSWEVCFNELAKRGLDVSHVRVGIMDGLSGLERVFKERFTNAVTARCWVHAMRNALLKAPARLREPFKRLAEQIMYAASENDARIAFSALKNAMGSDAQRAVACLEKDLDSLLVHYRFDKSFWRVLRSTNPIERIHREFKRRTKSMDTIGENTLQILQAFIAVRLEFFWKKNPVNAKHFENLRLAMRKTENFESAVETLVH